MASLYTLCEDVAELDILLALAQASSIGSYVRPEFNNYLEIRNCVHPLLDYNSQVLPVPNDVFASPEQNFTIITGPNMGGKSIYIKQIALMQVMAQIGCFLPATNCVFRLCDRIFSRIGFNDSVELNASTFVLEMKEMQHILKSLTPSSLVIIDELCRGTSCEEGTSIAWAICEELITSDAFTFFTTHFMYLTRLQELYYNVVNKHTAVIEENVTDGENTIQRLVYTHKVEPGVTKLERYGLALAAKTNLPDATVRLANELADLIIKNRKSFDTTSPQKRDEELLYNLNANIRHESRKNIDSGEIIKHILEKFKDENPALIERLKIQMNTTVINTDSSAKCSSTQTSKPQFSTERSKNSIRNNKNSIIKPSDVKFENLNILSSCNNKCNERGVRSSNELLTRMMNDKIKDLDNDLNIIAVSNAPTEISPCWDNNISNEVLNKANPDTSNIVNNNNKIGNHFDNCNKKLIDEEFENPTEDNKTIQIDSNVSDVSKDLTQLIDDCHVVNMEETLDSCEDMSLDEDLMIETVNEINEELNDMMDIERIVLTPPMNFRDV